MTLVSNGFGKSWKYFHPTITYINKTVKEILMRTQRKLFGGPQRSIFQEGNSVYDQLSLTEVQA